MGAVHDDDRPRAGCLIFDKYNSKLWTHFRLQPATVHGVLIRRGTVTLSPFQHRPVITQRYAACDYEYRLIRTDHMTIWQPLPVYSESFHADS